MDNKKEQKTNSSTFSEERLQRISCPIFSSKNEAMEKFATAINEAANIQKKAYIAACLIKEAEALLNCQYANKRKINCRICQKISELRKKTAELVTKARELA